MEENKRQFKGIWIPAEIWIATNLSWNEKILLAEIESFSSNDKDFYMSNEYISNFLGVTETTANKILSSLIKKGLVIKTRFDGRRRWVKSALPSSTTQPCSQEQPSLVAESNRYNNIIKENRKEYFGVDLSTPSRVAVKHDYRNSGFPSFSTDGPDGYADNGEDLAEPAKRKVAPKEKVEPWREDFDEYMKLVNEGAAALKADTKFRADVERLQPNVDYDKTIEWCVSQYWGTEAAWETKRKSRSKRIDMKATLRQNFDKNRIYKEGQRTGGYRRQDRPRDVDTIHVDDDWADILKAQRERVEAEERRRTMTDGGH